MPDETRQRPLHGRRRRRGHRLLHDPPRLHRPHRAPRRRSPTCAAADLRLLLSGPTSSAGRPMPDGRDAGPGGWNRIHLIVDDIAAEVERLRAAGADVPQRHRHRPRRSADPARGPVRQPDRALPARRTLTDRTRRDRPSDDPARRLRSLSSASGDGSAASASAGRRRTSRCCATCASNDGAGSPSTSSRTRSPPATCCPGRPRPSSRSSARGACAAARARSSAALAFIVPGLVADPRAVRAVPRGARRRRGSAAPAPGAGAAVAAVAVHAGADLAPSRAGGAPRARPAALGRLRAARRRRGRRPSARGSSSSCSLRRDRAARATDAREPVAARAFVPLPLLVAAGTGGLLVARLGRVQGRRALLRRRLRDHPADAGRRRRAATTG